MKNPFFKLLLPPLISIACIAGLFALKGHERFDEELFSNDGVKTHALALSSAELSGRGLGESGQISAENYLENYFKQESLSYETTDHKILVPSWDAASTFKIGTDNDYQLFKDYEPTADYYGDGLSFKGDILYAGNDYFNIEPSLMKNKVVFFFANRLTEEHMQRALEAGAKGILYYTTFSGLDNSRDHLQMDHKTLDLSHKIGNGLFMAEIGYPLLSKLQTTATDNLVAGYVYQTPDSTNGVYNTKLVGLVPNVSIQAKLNFSTVTAKNYIVSIKGKNHQKAINWMTHYDGLGKTLDSASHYPSTVDGAVTTAQLLELAKTAHKQGVLPENDLNFIFLSGLYTSDQPAKKMAELLQSQYSHNTNFIVENIGYKDSAISIIQWDAYNDFDRMVISQIRSNTDLFPGRFLSSGEGIYQRFDTYKAFKTVDSATLFITDQVTPDSSTVISSPDDNPQGYNPQNVNTISQIFLGYLDQQLYKETTFEFIKNKHLLILFIFMMGLHLLALPEKWTLLGNAPHFVNALSQQIPYKLLRKGIQGLIPFIFSIFIVNLILSIPADMNLKTVGSTYVTNFSLYETIKNSYIGFIYFLSALINPEPALFKEIILYLKRSLILVTWGMVLAVSLGLAKGLLDAYLHKGRTGLSTLSGIVLYSIPDVLIAFLSMVSIVYLSKIPWVIQLADVNTLRLYIMPLLSLTIVPVIYISRLVFVAIEEEKKKDYVKFLAYKGLNKRQIYWNHFSRVALIKILDSAKAIVMLIFSNLIVVEYLFNYPGIMLNIIESVGEPIKVILLALSIGVSFVLIYLLSVMLLNIVHPGRRVR